MRKKKKILFLIFVHKSNFSIIIWSKRGNETKMHKISGKLISTIILWNENKTINLLKNKKNKIATKLNGKTWFLYIWRRNKKIQTKRNCIALYPFQLQCEFLGIFFFYFFYFAKCGRNLKWMKITQFAFNVLLHIIFVFFFGAFLFLNIIVVPYFHRRSQNLLCKSCMDGYLLHENELNVAHIFLWQVYEFKLSFKCE